MRSIGFFASGEPVVVGDEDNVLLLGLVGESGTRSGFFGIGNDDDVGVADCFSLLVGVVVTGESDLIWLKLFFLVNVALVLGVIRDDEEFVLVTTRVGFFMETVIFFFGLSPVGDEDKGDLASLFGDFVCCCFLTTSTGFFAVITIVFLGFRSSTAVVTFGFSIAKDANLSKNRKVGFFGRSPLYLRQFSKEKGGSGCDKSM